MISSISFKNLPGYLGKIEALEGKEIKFNPGLNIIMGGNGSGKTTLVRLLAMLTGSNADLHQPLNQLRDDNDKHIGFPASAIYSLIHEQHPKIYEKMKIDLSWSGYATTFYKASDEFQMPLMVETAEDVDKIFRVKKMSSGENIMSSTNKFICDAVKIKNVKATKQLQGNDQWVAAAKKWNDWVEEHTKSFKITSKLPTLTIIGDELDCALSIPAQERCWKEMAKIDCERARVQFILVSHSPIVPALFPEKNIINFNEDFSNEIRRVFTKLYSTKGDKVCPKKQPLSKRK